VISKETINPNKKENKNFELLCDMAELTALFESKSSLPEFLSDVVGMVGAHMRSDVCSVYLYHHQEDALILRATKGLKVANTTMVSLKPGEGITGKAFEESRSIREGRASQNPYFKPIPGIEEEMYEAFLAVPIRRGVNRIGVLTLQDRKKNAFSHHDTRALKAIASQLAATLENAEALIEFYQTSEIPVGYPLLVNGVSAGSGIAIGKAHILRTRSESFAPLILSESERTRPFSETEELVLFAKSLGATKTQLESMQRTLDIQVAEVADLIFSAHLLMLRDEKFSGAMQESIHGGEFADRAITSVVNRYVQMFLHHDNPRIKEKAQDILDLGNRLLRNLGTTETSNGDYSGQVVVTPDIFPSELVKLAAQNAAGVVTLGSGHTAHVALLARSLKLPTLFLQSDVLSLIRQGSNLIVDGSHEQLHVEPDTKILKEFQGILKTRSSTLPIDCPRVSLTIDGTVVKVLANVNLIQDVEAAQACHAEGVGLYRSEFPFLVRNDFPSEEEQTRLYRRVLEPMEGKEVVIRTLDVGGDKLLGVHHTHRENNPFLGFRGIRFSLSNPEIFSDQLRAILRAGVDRDLRIMFPMISSLDEFLSAKEQVDLALNELANEGLTHNSKPLIGAMIELPAAVEIASDLSKRADFLSVGTNDLIMYTLAVDRTNEQIGTMYTAHHPAVLRSLDRIIKGVGRKISELSVCGEAVHDPALLTFLVGRGVRKVSVDPNRIPKLKQRIQEITLSKAARTAKDLLRVRTLKEMDAYIVQNGLSTIG